jgi:hypothetical protein
MSYSNPYQSYGQPLSYGGPSQFGSPPVDPMKINAPAIGLIAVGAIDLLQSVYALGRNLLGMNANAPPPRNIQNNPELMEIYDTMKPYQFVMNVTLGSMALLCAVVIILAGVMMLQRKMYPLCVTGSILAAIPCLSFLACCLVGEGVGIWALVILMSADVKRSFQG